MSALVPLTAKAKRKIARRLANEAEARIARFWRKPGSAERMNHTRPVNKQAAYELRKWSKRRAT
jgi:hypothetical protein